MIKKQTTLQRIEINQNINPSHVGAVPWIARQTRLPRAYITYKTTRLLQLIVRKIYLFFTHFRKTKNSLLGRVSRGKRITLKVTRIARSTHTYRPIFVTFSSCRRKGTRVYTQNRSRCCVPSRTTTILEETLLPIERGKPPEARRLSSFSAASGSRRSRSPVTFPGTRARPESYSLSVRIKVRRIRWCCTPGVRQSRRYVSEI